MAETTSNGTAAAPDPGQRVQTRVVAQFIKDLSFENPNIARVLQTPDDKPNLRIEVNVNGTRAGDKMFESAIKFRAEATGKAGIVYELELEYAGLFHAENLPDNLIEPFLLIHCPTLLFPFVRRIVADLTREGGFPPLLLDPIDFAALAQHRREQMAAQAGKNS